MEILLDPLSDTPLYQQLRDRMVEAIAAGRLQPGDQLESVRRLAGAYGINVATVGKGYELLRQEGLILTNHKSGSIVARGPLTGPGTASFTESWTPRLTTLLAEAVAQGLSRADISSSVSAVLDALAEEYLTHPSSGATTAPHDETDTAP
jgi:DNA-binding transcriptional regulator YhcF (GntR family)